MKLIGLKNIGKKLNKVKLGAQVIKDASNIALKKTMNAITDFKNTKVGEDAFSNSNALLYLGAGMLLTSIFVPGLAIFSLAAMALGVIFGFGDDKQIPTGRTPRQIAKAKRKMAKRDASIEKSQNRIAENMQALRSDKTKNKNDDFTKQVNEIIDGNKNEIEQEQEQKPNIDLTVEQQDGADMAEGVEEPEVVEEEQQQENVAQEVVEEPEIVEEAEMDKEQENNVNEEYVSTPPAFVEPEQEFVVTDFGDRMLLIR